MASIPHNFIPRDYQLELFRAMDGIAGKPETKKKRAILRWHRRAGKDKACFNYMIKEAAQVVGNYFYIFPTKVMARLALWENHDSSEFKTLNHIPKEFITRSSNQEMSVELINGSTIRLVGYDKNPDSIRGVSAKGVVFSEFAFSDPECYRILVPVLRESNGWAIVNSTPDGKNHFYEMWKRAEQSDAWFTSIKQTYWHDRENYTGLVPKDQIQDVQSDEGYTDDEMEQEYGVSFATGMKGTYYSDYIDVARGTGRVGMFPYDDTYKVDTFWDLGVDDSTAVWFRQRKGNAIIFIDYFEDSGKGLKNYVSMLDKKGYEYGTHYLPHDARQRSLQSGVSTGDMLEDMLRDSNISGYVDILPRLGVQEGINSVRSRFSRYFFDESKCQEGLAKLEMYHKRWDKKRQVYLKEPVHDSTSHAADAIRMEAISDDSSNDPFLKNNKIKVNNDFDLFDF